MPACGYYLYRSVVLVCFNKRVPLRVQGRQQLLQCQSPVACRGVWDLASRRELAQLTVQ